MSLDKRIIKKQDQIRSLMADVDTLLKENSMSTSDGKVRSNEELLEAGKRLDKITDLNLKIAKLRGQLNKLEDKKMIKNRILKRD